MYVHVGEDILVRARDIIAILDKGSVSSSDTVQEFLDFHKNHVVDLTKGTFKSIVITADKVYFSPLASATLKKRSHKLAVQEFA